MIVKLSAQEIITAASVGMRRETNAIRKGSKQYGDDGGMNWFNEHIMGAMSEYVVAKLLNLFWPPVIGDIDTPDVGGFVEVRVRRVPGTGTDLAIRPKDRDELPFVQVLGYLDARFDVLGWLYAGDAKARTDKIWCEKKGVWFVPPPYQPIESLIEICRPPALFVTRLRIAGARCMTCRRVVLSLCDRTGGMVRPWVEAGYHAVTVDLQRADPENPAQTHLVADVCRWHYPMRLGLPAIIFAFPPCTHLAISGARWMRAKGLSVVIDALAIANACRELVEGAGVPYMLENPVGTLATYWREPDHKFDPCDYGDPYTKNTCLWTGGGFRMPEKIDPGDMFAAPTRVEPVMGSMTLEYSPSEDRGDLRSVTPPGFARAVFRANCI